MPVTQLNEYKSLEWPVTSHSRLVCSKGVTGFSFTNDAAQDARGTGYMMGVRKNSA